MNSTYRKIAAALAFIIGGLAVFAGGQVLLGKVMDYYVIDWLLIYNFSVGLLSSFVTALLIWTGSKYALLAAAATFTGHGIVMLILQTAYKDLVAPDSIRAMTVRLIVWLLILALMIVQDRKNNSRTGEKHAR